MLSEKQKQKVIEYFHKNNTKNLIGSVEKVLDEVLNAIENVKKKIIFLDIDGVMNSQLMYERDKNYEQQKDEIDDSCMKVLSGLIEDTGAEVVITSVWRYSHKKEELQKIFEKHGFTGKIIGATDVLPSDCVRGDEILKWIKDNEDYLNERYYNFDSYVIFDDDGDMLWWQRHNFILVDGYAGLTQNLAYRAKWILNR